MQLNFENLRPQIAKALDINPADIELTTILSGNEKWDSFAVLSVVARGSGAARFAESRDDHCRPRAVPCP